MCVCCSDTICSVFLQQFSKETKGKKLNKKEYRCQNFKTTKETTKWMDQFKECLFLIDRWKEIEYH